LPRTFRRSGSRSLARSIFTEEEKKEIEAMGGLDKLLETLRQRMQEQKGRHQGGKKWIGTAGTRRSALRL